jgi:hypothetical protein
MPGYDEDNIQSVPVIYHRGRYTGWLAEQKDKPDGKVVGVLLYLIDEMRFEAWRYRADRSVLLGAAETAPSALSLFYRHDRIPRTGGIISHRMKHGIPRQVESVRWCGGWRTCDCWDDGCVERHRFRWEYSQHGKRWVRE